jgi:hypothetical protein
MHTPVGQAEALGSSVFQGRDSVLLLGKEVAGKGEPIGLLLLGAASSRAAVNAGVRSKGDA